jgi:hypothetical protein
VSKKNGSLLFACIAITLAILNGIILTTLRRGDQVESTVKFQYTHLPQFLVTPTSIGNDFQPVEDDSRSRNSVSYSGRIATKISGDSSLSNTTEGILLLNYIQQFNPSDSQQLDFIFQVAADAQRELSDEQLTASEILSYKKARLEALIDQAVATPNSAGGLSGQRIYILQTYLTKLEDRQNLSERIAIQAEKIDTRRAQNGLPDHAAQISLPEETALLEVDRSALSVLDREIASLEVDLSKIQEELPASLSAECTALLQDYKRRMEAFSDQEITVNKFESILAAARYVDFSTI